METKHARLAATLRRQIEDGALEGEVPSEADLMQQSGYARATVRQALATLENEGLISGAQGSRRHVRDRHRWQWPMSTWEKAHTGHEDAWATSIRDQGGAPSATVAVLVEQANRAVAEALDVDQGAHVVVRRRIRSVDGEPHQLADSYFPYWLAEQHPIFLEPGDLAAPGGLLASVGLPQARLLDEITSRMPTPDEARTLAMSRGVPLLVHSRTGYGKDDKPLRYMISRMAADRVHVRYELDA